MKSLLIKKAILFFCFIVFAFATNAQRVTPLVPGITIDSVLHAKPNASKMAWDAVSGHLFYTTSDGNIYEVYIPASGPATDSLRYTVADHSISFLQGLYFRDSVMYICGNIWSATTTVGKVLKATLQPNGTRTWASIMTTVPYPDADVNGDHGFAGVNVDPAGNYIYVSSGARTHLGEIRTNGGAWPGCREVPLTTRIYRFPINTTGLVLANDSTTVDNSGYVFAWGTRNSYDMAWDANDNLFAIDNSGERDDPEELNWLRQGKHYGFPWNMGGNYNPLMVSPYDVNQDLLVNHQSSGYMAGWFADDPTFPAVPAGITFTDPVRNYGVDADFYRDPVTGKVKNASDEGTYITSFTPHRSPLGLVIDKDSILGGAFRGDAFLVSFMPGGDSTGYTPLSPWGTACPFVDPTRDLLQMKLTYNAGIDNYTMTTKRIVDGFYLTVDAELVSNTMYVIENGGNIWKVNLPLYTGIPELQKKMDVLVYPNPAQNMVAFEFETPAAAAVKISISDVQGRTVSILYEKETGAGQQKIITDISSLQAGIYFYTITVNNNSSVGKIVKIR
ncbi:MAG: hypothetical protein JWP12_2157 [Bacteroidetes bacterium]|nr:hypothetical protein [Bacteroidota bacterium]